MKRSDRIFWGVYILWAFANLVIFLFWGTIKQGAVKHFFPFSHHVVWQGIGTNYKIVFYDISSYDYTELIFYCTLPVVIFFAVKLLFPSKNK